jgi:putative nucleotidyltransferase with HDIG domain
MANTFKANIQKIEKLPTIPEIAHHLLHISNDPLFSIDELKSIVEKDPAISARIIGVANSAFFGASVRTSKLDDAIMRIGLNNVKSIAVGISVLTLFGENKITSDYKRLFNHSVIVGLTARSLARKFRTIIGENILLDGLLHDLGYLVLNGYFPEVYQNMLDSFQCSRSLLDAEKNTLGYSHAEIGFWLAEQWNLPNTVLDTILYHHTPSLSRNNTKRVAIIHIADYIVSKESYGPFEKDPNYSLDQDACALLGISDDDLKHMEGTAQFADEIFNMPDSARQKSMDLC